MTHEQREQVGETNVFVTPDEVDGLWDVSVRIRRKMTSRGFVYQETDGTWSAARHTYSGVPAQHSRGGLTRDAAALTLEDAKPFRGAQYDHPSLG